MHTKPGLLYEAMATSPHDSLIQKRSRADKEAFRPRKKLRVVQGSAIQDDVQKTTGLNEVSTNRPASSNGGNAHTRKERKNNRSTRIHSLRKQLSFSSLPQTVHREKERELEALLLEQQKDRRKQDRKKNLERYHYVRFIERQKAEKRLKKLKKLQQRGDESEKLEQEIHEMEVSKNYAIYAPLGQKYIALFATNPTRSNGEIANNEVTSREGDATAGLHDRQRRRLQEAATSENNETRAEHDKQHGLGEKPRIWYEVEAAMARGQKHLEALRDGKSQAVLHETDIDPSHDGRLKQFIPAKLSSHHLGTSHKRGRNEIKGGKDAVDVHAEPGSSDGDMSDGGFFER